MNKLNKLLNEFTMQSHKPQNQKIWNKNVQKIPMPIKQNYSRNQWNAVSYLKPLKGCIIK